MYAFARAAALPGAEHAKAVPVERNNAMLAVLQIGILAFAGYGINDNLVDKLSIPLFNFRKGGA